MRLVIQANGVMRVEPEPLLAELSPSTALLGLAAAPADEAPQVLIAADRIDGGRTGEQGRIVATGNVRATYEQYVLTADRLVLDQSTYVASAEGNVRQTFAGRELRAERLEWDYLRETGRAFGAETEYRGVIVRGKEILFREERQQALDASFTTCDLPRPHYRLTARSIGVAPGERVLARGVSPWLLGVRLLTLPRVAFSLREGAGGESIFPRIGYNAREGFYVGRRIRLVDATDYTVLFDGRLALRRGFLGKVEGWENGRRLRWISAVGIKEPAPNQRVRFLDVDRLPEVGLLWAPNRDTQSRFLPTQVQDESPLPRDEPWLQMAQLTLGYFRQRQEEFRGDIAVEERGLRLDGRALFSGPSIPVGGLRVRAPRVLARAAVYSGGDHLLLLGVGAEIAGRIGRDVSVRLERFSHWQSGESHFLFDTLEIRDEWRPHVTIRGGLNTFTWTARYDARASALFDQELGFARVLHCLEPRLTYGVRRRQIGLEIRIVGLQRDE